METQISYTQSRTARARLRGSCLVITLPRHWPRSEQEAAVAKFKRWGEKQTSVLATLPDVEPTPALSLSELTALVARVNQETLNVTYAGVRIGQARYTRLAQVNLKTKILTFSRYAIDGMPERALRYLILHELSHLIVPNHSAAFWRVVGTHMPDFRQQRQLAQTHFQLACMRTEGAQKPPTRTPVAPVLSPLPVAAPVQPPLPLAAVRQSTPAPAKPARAAAPQRPQQLRLF